MDEDRDLELLLLVLLLLWTVRRLVSHLVSEAISPDWTQEADQ